MAAFSSSDDLQGARFVETNLQGALDTLADTPDVWVTGVSPLYETEPVGAPEGSDTFLNVVVLLDTTLSVHTLLDRALAIEDAYGREREGTRNANGYEHEFRHGVPLLRWRPARPTSDQEIRGLDTIQS